MLIVFHKFRTHRRNLLGETLRGLAALFFEVDLLFGFLLDTAKFEVSTPFLAEKSWKKFLRCGAPLLAQPVAFANDRPARAYCRAPLRSADGTCGSEPEDSTVVVTKVGKMAIFTSTRIARPRFCSVRGAIPPGRPARRRLPPVFAQATRTREQLTARERGPGAEPRGSAGGSRRRPRRRGYAWRACGCSCRCRCRLRRRRAQRSACWSAATGRARR